MVDNMPVVKKILIVVMRQCALTAGCRVSGGTGGKWSERVGMHLEPQRQVEREGQQWSINSASGWGEVDMWHFFDYKQSIMLVILCWWGNCHDRSNSVTDTIFFFLQFPLLSFPLSLSSSHYFTASQPLRLYGLPSWWPLRLLLVQRS